MANSIEIIFEAKDMMAGVMRGITSQMGGLGTILSGINDVVGKNTALFGLYKRGLTDTSVSVNDMRRAEEAAQAATARLAETLAVMAIKTIQDCIKKTVEYANSVRELSMLSGESTEESSRFIQVLDDYKISADDALVATRALTREGYTPSIETLAKLSDEYLSLNTTQEKNDFILKNLGRSGLKWAEVLGKGSNALIKQGKAVSQSLILTKKAVDDARELEIATDQLGESTEKLGIALGIRLIPALVDLVNNENDVIRTREILAEQGRNWLFTSNKMWDAAMDQAQAEREAATATMVNTKALIDSSKSNEDSLKARADAIKGITSANEDFLSRVDDIATSNKKLKDDQDEINQKYKDGTITLGERDQALQDLATAQEEASRRMILAMLQEQLAVDGLSKADTTYLLDLGLKWGIYSEEAVSSAKDAQREVDILTRKFNNLPSQKDIYITVNTNASTALGALQNISGFRAGGGPVDAGRSYMVGERGPERFTPNAGGTITPNNAMIDYKKMSRAIVQALQQAGG